MPRVIGRGVVVNVGNGSAMLRNVYILSAGRSGSTLTSLILGSHPNAISVGELFHLPKNLALNTACACGCPIRDCGFWQAVVRDISDKLGLEILRDPYSLDLGFIGAITIVDPKHQTKFYRAIWKARHALIRFQMQTGTRIPRVVEQRFAMGITNTLVVYDAIRRVSHSDVIIDSSKGYLRGIAMYQRNPEATRLLLLSRDGRGRLFSGRRSGHSRRSTVDGWRKYYEHALPLLEKHVPANHWLPVHYEDLAGAPESETRRICNFLGLAFDPVMLDFRRKENHVANGNDMRLQDSRQIVLDTAWQRELTVDDLEYFERRGGPMNRRLGYT